MKFVALLMISAVAADAAPKEVAAGKSCKDAKTTKCAATDCCGTVTDAKDASVKAADGATSLVKGFAATVCSTKPTDDETKDNGKGGKFVVVAKADAVGTEGADGYKAPVTEVAGTFLCNADAAAAGDAASYMTVGAAAIIAAATLLQ